MVKDHMKDANAFDEASKNAKEPDVRAFAQRTLPVIKAHLKKGQEHAVQNPHDISDPTPLLLKDGLRVSAPVDHGPGAPSPRPPDSTP
jgi:hypothetical protein